jgi:hypothetical protein
MSGAEPHTQPTLIHPRPNATAYGGAPRGIRFGPPSPGAATVPRQAKSVAEAGAHRG